MAELNMVAPMAILNIATCLERALEYFGQAVDDGRDTKPCREAVRKIHTEFLTACRKDLRYIPAKWEIHRRAGRACAAWWRRKRNKPSHPPEVHNALQILDSLPHSGTR